MSFGRWVKKGSTPSVATEKWPNRDRYKHLKESICHACLEESREGADWEPGVCAFCGRLEPSYVKEALCYFHEEEFGSPHPYYSLWSSEWGVAATTDIPVDEAWVESVALSALRAHANDLDSIARKLRGYPSDPFCYYRYTFAERGIEAELANMAASSDIGWRHAIEKLRPVLMRMKEILVERGYTWL